MKNSDIVDNKTLAGQRMVNVIDTFSKKINSKNESMKPIESSIEKAAGAIIDELGINALTVDALALQMGIQKNELPTYLKNEDDILKFLALRLENEIQQLIHNLEAMHHEPERELSDLFTGLNDFYNRKPHFLELMFADDP